MKKQPTPVYECDMCGTEADAELVGMPDGEKRWIIPPGWMHVRVRQRKLVAPLDVCSQACLEKAASQWRDHAKEETK